VLVHGGTVDRLPEARPPGAGIELGLRFEERRAASRALVEALLLRRVVLAREGALRAVLPQHPVLLGRQALPPLLVAQDDLVAHRQPSFCMSHSSGVFASTRKTVPSGATGPAGSPGSRSGPRSIATGPSAESGATSATIRIGEGRQRKTSSRSVAWTRVPSR